jgi:hypothetical protein
MKPIVLRLLSIVFLFFILSAQSNASVTFEITGNTTALPFGSFDFRVQATLSEQSSFANPDITLVEAITPFGFFDERNIDTIFAPLASGQFAVTGQNSFFNLLVVGQFPPALAGGVDITNVGLLSQTQILFATLTFAGGTIEFTDTVFNAVGLAAPGGLNPTVGAVPEPATWLMMIIGFAIIGAGIRAKNKIALSA